MKNFLSKISIIALFIVFTNQAYSKVIYACNHDTLKYRLNESIIDFDFERGDTLVIDDGDTITVYTNSPEGVSAWDWNIEGAYLDTIVEITKKGFKFMIEYNAPWHVFVKFYVMSIDLKLLNIGNYGAYIPEMEIEIDGHQYFQEILWNTGDTSGIFYPKSIGDYWVETQTHCNRSTSNTVNLIELAYPNIYAGQTEGQELYYYNYAPYLILAPDGYSHTDSSIFLDIDKDGINDFELRGHLCQWSAFHEVNASITPLNGSEIYSYQTGYADRLKDFETIDSNLVWSNSSCLLHYYFYDPRYIACPSIKGKWGGVNEKLLGFRIVDSGIFKYGWMKLSISEDGLPYVIS